MSEHEKMGEKAEAEANYLEERADRLAEDIEAARDRVEESHEDPLIPAPAEFDTDQSDEPEADYPAKR